jgi:hypothetical protein
MNGGAVNQASHALGITGGRCIIEDTSIGVTTGYGTNVLEYYTGMVVVCRNVTWGGTGPNGPSTTQRSAEVFTEDDDGTFEDHEAYYRAGTITRDTATTRSGGADSSSKMEPSAACGPNDPLILGEPLWGFAAIWATASVQINISVWARVGSAWDTALTAAECYAKFSYLSNAGNATRTQVDSTETINNAGTWTALTSGNITPSRTGWVYIWFYLEEYEDATEHVLVDILPTVS